MSVKIHHGVPGSFKTSGAIQDDFIPAVLAGRKVVTNVRGLDDEQKVIDVLTDQGHNVPSSFRLVHVDTSTSSGLDVMRKWFHALTPGALLFVDEIQEIYPRSMRDSDVNKLNYPGGVDVAEADNRPSTLALAFEKHRHYNWDCVFTTPHISKVHPLVRSVAEGAYKHKNLGILGSLFKGAYIEGFHGADTNGKGSDFYAVQRKKIKPYVFDLYGSTATGVVNDTIAGQSLFKNPKILGLSLGLLFLVGYLVTRPVPTAIKSVAEGVPEQDVMASAKVGVVGSSKSSGDIAGVGGSGLPVGLPVAPRGVDRLGFVEWPATIESNGYAFGVQLWRLRFAGADGRRVELKHADAVGLGLQVTFRGDCYAEVRRSGAVVAVATCPAEVVLAENGVDQKSDAEVVATKQPAQ